MAKITFWCDEETSEWGPSDSPYFLVYAGDANLHKSVVRRVRHPSWDNNVDAGEPKRSDTVSFPGLSTLSIVYVALIEEDDGPDFANPPTAVQNWMDNLDGLLQPTLLEDGSSASIILCQEFVKSINHFIGNDDLVGVKRFKAGQRKNFAGHGGKYRVQFDV